MGGHVTHVRVNFLSQTLFVFLSPVCPLIKSLGQVT